MVVEGGNGMSKGAEVDEMLPMETLPTWAPLMKVILKKASTASNENDT
jgi:hypothetical protein